MNQRTPIPRISAKRLRELGGKMPFSSIRPRKQFPRKGKPRSTRGITRKESCASARETRRNLAKHRAAAGLQPKSGRRVNRLPEWTDPRSYITKGGRHRLKGQDYERLRVRCYLRAKARCECGCGRTAYADDITPLADRGEMAHSEHGARKSDELNRVKWMRHECHMKSHNCGGKPITVTKKSLRVA